MRCLGFTNRFRRCRNNGEPLFCRHHRWQPVTILFSAITFFSVLAGIYQDALSPIYRYVVGPKNNVEYWGIQVSYFMRVRHDGYAMQEKFSGPRIVRLREPIIYFESEHRIGLTDTNITFINRTDGSVIEKHEFEGDAKTYRQPYVDDRVVSTDFDIEVVECFALHLEDENLWVREFRVKQPDTQRLTDLVIKERNEDFNLVSVFNPDPVFARSKLICPPDLRSDPMYKDFQRSGVSEPLVDIASAYVDPLSDVDLSQIKPEFEASWYQGALRVWLKTISGLPDSVKLEMSDDGETFYPTTSDQNFLPRDQFLLRSQSPGLDGNQFSIDLTQQARDAAEAALATQSGSHVLDCKPGYCELPRNAYCNSNWTKIAFGREKASEEIAVDLAQCAQQNTSHKICLSTPISLFPTGPSQRIYASIYDDSGEKFSFPLIVSEWHHSNQANAIELKTIDSDEKAPFAIAWYEPGFGRHTDDFRIQFAAGGCHPSPLALEGGMSGVFYDIDGKGDVRGQLRYFSVPKPENGTVKITFRSKDGQVYGPFTYAISYEEVIKASIAEAERPETIHCRRDLNNRFDVKSWYYTCRIQPNWVELIGWANVSQVRFGQNADALTDVLEPKVDINRMLKIFAEHDSRQIPMIAEYLPDRTWREVYFQIVYKDGSETLVQRLVLPDPL